MVNLHNIAKAIVREIKKEIIKMDLINTAAYLSSIKYKIEGTVITFYSSLKYAEALEYGTYDFGKLNFPATAEEAKSVKKKDLSPVIRKQLPKGMVAFAPFRRVLYNEVLIKSIIMANSK